MSPSENAAELSTGSAPQCPFPLAYAPRALDDIRLAVVDAFFSLPRGGAEIGGVLFGHWDGRQLAITDYAALDCEHAFGPSFTLSPLDQSRLADMLAATYENGLRPVGWYHSHTRSEIFLSDADLEIHRRFFPESWQVALVLKPHSYNPTRAGFFFREAGGAIHAKASYHEFVLAPLLVQPAPSGAPMAVEPEPEPSSPVLETLPVPEPLPVPGPMPFGNSAPQGPPRRQSRASELEEPPEEPGEATPASRLHEEPQPGPRRPPKLVLAAMALVAFCLGAYWKRDLWRPDPATAQHTAPLPAPPPPLGLNTIDSEGQLQIRWNRNSPTILQASGGVLSINTGGPFPQEIPLDKAHLLSGVFTFARQTERVDVSLGLTQPDGHAPREVTTFIGKLPDKKLVEDPAGLSRRDSLAKQVANMRSDLNAEIARNAKLRQTVDQLSKRLREQQRSRLHNQVAK